MEKELLFGGCSQLSADMLLFIVILPVPTCQANLSVGMIDAIQRWDAESPDAPTRPGGGLGGTQPTSPGTPPPASSASSRSNRLASSLASPTGGTGPVPVAVALLPPTYTEELSVKPIPSPIVEDNALTVPPTSRHRTSSFRLCLGFHHFFLWVRTIYWVRSR